MINANEFAGRVAVVTGGSEGIGFDFCRALCEVGCEVYFCARHAEKGQPAAKVLGKHAHYYQTDLTAYPSKSTRSPPTCANWRGMWITWSTTPRTMTGSSLMTFPSRSVTACGP